MCVACHRLRSVIDQRLGIEGSQVASPWLVVRRLAAWAGCLATFEGPVTFPTEVLAGLATVLEAVADELAREGAA
jgi:hypothetical protein